MAIRCSKISIPLFDVRYPVTILWLALLAACATATNPVAERRAQPNVVVILLDDMGFSDPGFMGSEIATPSIDRLAAGGVTVSQFYVQPRCSPTRAALLTGRAPHESGLGFLAVPATMASSPGAYQGYLEPGIPTLASELKALGYATYMSGKWHLGEAASHWPRRYGFDRYFGLLSGASSYYELLTASDRRMARDDEAYVPGNGFHMTEATSRQALTFLREHREREDSPFFLYLAYTAPHWPLHARPDDIAAYAPVYAAGLRSIAAARRAALAERGFATNDASIAQDANDPQLMAAYAAMITAADRGIGTVLAELESAGELDNTLILVFSDNGASAEDVSARRLHDPDKAVGGTGQLSLLRPRLGFAVESAAAGR